MPKDDGNCWSKQHKAELACMWDSLEYMSLVAHTALPRRSVCTPLIWCSLQLRGLVYRALHYMAIGFNCEQNNIVSYSQSGKVVE